MEAQLSFILSQITRLTDRQTEFSSLDRICIPCSAVKMKINKSKNTFSAGLQSEPWLTTRPTTPANTEKKYIVLYKREIFTDTVHASTSPNYAEFVTLKKLAANKHWYW